MKIKLICLFGLGYFCLLVNAPLFAIYIIALIGLFIALAGIFRAWSMWNYDNVMDEPIDFEQYEEVKIKDGTILFPKEIMEFASHDLRFEHCDAPKPLYQKYPNFKYDENTFWHYDENNKNWEKSAYLNPQAKAWGDGWPSNDAAKGVIRSGKELNYLSKAWGDEYEKDRK